MADEARRLAPVPGEWRTHQHGRRVTCVLSRVPETVWRGDQVPCRRKPEPLPEASRMGFRSRLVLEKLAFELRERFDAELLGPELPPDLHRLAERMNPGGVVRMPRAYSDDATRFSLAL